MAVEGVEQVGGADRVGRQDPGPVSRPARGDAGRREVVDHVRPARPHGLSHRRGVGQVGDVRDAPVLDVAEPGRPFGRPADEVDLVAGRDQ